MLLGAIRRPPVMKARHSRSGFAGALANLNSLIDHSRRPSLVNLFPRLPLYPEYSAPALHFYRAVAAIGDLRRDSRRTRTRTTCDSFSDAALPDT